MMFFIIYLLPVTCFADNSTGGVIFGIMWMLVISLVVVMECDRRIGVYAMRWRIKL